MLALALLLQARIVRADGASATQLLAIPETSYVRLEPSVTFDDGHVASEVFSRGVLVYCSVKLDLRIDITGS